jgi:hypothetical protein
MDECAIHAFSRENNTWLSINNTSKMHGKKNSYL